MAEDPRTAELLLENLQSLRALARRLTRDAAAADDAVQDACVAALSARAPAKSAFGGWLATVLRNRVRQDARAATRRRAREGFAAGAPAAAPSAAEAAAELQWQRRLVELVHELEEPSRHALFLRFWRGLEPAAIAVLLRVPVKTVHSRIERGLARLRERLDAERGGRAAWLPGIAAFAHGGRVPADLGGAASAAGTTAAATTAVTAVVLLMKTKTIALLAVAAASLAAIPFLWPGDPAAPAGPGAGAPAASGPVAVASPASPDAASRTALAPAPAERGVAPAAAPAAPEVAGTVCDLAGGPIAGVEVVFARAGADGALVRDAAVPAAVSDAGGAFRLPLPEGEGCLTVESGAWACVQRPWLRGSVPSEPPVVVVAAARSWSGAVVDPAGLPAGGARVTVLVDEETVPVRAAGGRSIALPNDLGSLLADAQGRFHFARIGFVPGAQVRARLTPHRDAAMALPDAPAHDLLLRLGAAAEEQFVHGIVLDANGRTVAGAFASCGGEAVLSAADGRFAAPWAWKLRPKVVRAVHAVHGAAEVALARAAGSGDDRERPVELRLLAPGAIEGRVVDAAGTPVAGARVWTPDLTFLGMVEREEQGRQLSMDTAIETFATGSKDWTGLATTTGADGTFVLRGLCARRYALFALAPQSLAGAGPVDTAPGESIELRLEGEPGRLVAGVAKDRDGAPLAGVRVSLGRRLPWQRPQRDPDPWGNASTVPPAASQLFRDLAVTDAQGRFRFENVHTAGAYLVFRGGELFFAQPVELDGARDPANLDLVLPVRSAFTLVLERPDEADGFKLTTADGGHVTVLVPVEGFEMSMGRIDLAGGRSPLTTSGAGEVVVVLLRGKKEVRRAAVRLPPGKGHEVRL